MKTFFDWLNKTYCTYNRQIPSLVWDSTHEDYKFGVYCRYFKENGYFVQQHPNELYGSNNLIQTNLKEWLLIEKDNIFNVMQFDTFDGLVKYFFENETTNIN